LAPGAKGNKVKVLRNNNGRIQSRTYDLNAISQGYQGDVSLQVGDRIEVDQPGKPKRDNSLVRVGIGLALLILFGFGG